MRLLLIRHGQTPTNLSGALDTAAPGPGLTDLGHAQADAVPAALAGVPLDGIYVSGLVRTHLTAAPLVSATGLSPQVHEGLNEISAGTLEGRADAAAVDDYRRCGSHWAHGDLDAALPGAETGHEFVQRFESAIRHIAASHGGDATVAVFGHGAAIRVFATIAAGLDPETPAERGLLNTGLVELSGDPAGGWQMLRWTDDPIGGEHLAGSTEHDVTADPDAVPTGGGEGARHG